MSDGKPFHSGLTIVLNCIVNLNLIWNLICMEIYFYCILTNFINSYFFYFLLSLHHHNHIIIITTKSSSTSFHTSL